MSMSSCDAGRASPGAPRCTKPLGNRSTSAAKGRTTINQEPHMARKAFAVNDAVRERVRHLAGIGLRQDDIAKIIACSSKTRAHWQEKTAPDHPVPGVKPFLVDDARQRLIDEIDRLRARKEQKGE